MKITPFRYPTNFAKVDDFLMRSSQPSPQEIVYLKKKEFLTDIFNISNNSPKVATQNEIQTAKNLGINYCFLPTETENPLQQTLEKFLNYTDKLKTQKTQKALVHCNAGVDRTGAFVVFYQLKNKLKTFDEAIKQMIEMGHHPEFHPKLIGKIAEIAKKMKLI